MTSPEEIVRTDLPNYPLSLARATAPWKRAASAHTVLPEARTRVEGWRVDPDRLADYRRLLRSSAEVPLAFPQVPVMSLHIDLLSQWSFPIRAVGLVHVGTVVEVLQELPSQEAWDVRAWVSGGRHVRSGFEFDLCGEVLVDDEVCWRSTAVTLSRSQTAAGAEPSSVVEPDVAGDWDADQVITAEEGTGRAFGRVTGDVNPIHLHALSARLFGFRRAIAHGWWTTGRTVAALGLDEAHPGRLLDVSFRRPVELPSTPVLRSRHAAGRRVEFALFPVAPSQVDVEPVRPLAAGSVSG